MREELTVVESIDDILGAGNSWTRVTNVQAGEQRASATAVWPRGRGKSWGSQIPEQDSGGPWQAAGHWRKQWDTHVHSETRGPEVTTAVRDRASLPASGGGADPTPSPGKSQPQRKDSRVGRGGAGPARARHCGSSVTTQDIRAHP